MWRRRQDESDRAHRTRSDNRDHHGGDPPRDHRRGGGGNGAMATEALTGVQKEK